MCDKSVEKYNIKIDGRNVVSYLTEGTSQPNVMWLKNMNSTIHSTRRKLGLDNSWQVIRRSNTSQIKTVRFFYTFVQMRLWRTEQ